MRKREPGRIVTVTRKQIAQFEYKKTIEFPTKELQDDVTLWSTLLQEAILRCRNSISYFSKENKVRKDWYRKRNKWLEQAFEFPHYVLPNEVKEQLKKLKVFKLKNDNEFRAELVLNFRKVFERLTQLHKIKKPDARIIILDFLQQHFPDHSEIAAMKNDRAWEKAFKNSNKLPFTKNIREI